MPIHKRTERKQEIVEKEVIDSVECSLCSQTFKDALPDYDGEIEWNTEPYSAEKTAVYMRDGNIYPESGSGNQIKFEICPHCFKNVLVPYLVARGAKPTIREWNY